MGFNYAAEKKKFETLWARLRREYRAAGMSDAAIRKMHDFDWEVFKQERRGFIAFIRRTWASVSLTSLPPNRRTRPSRKLQRKWASPRELSVSNFNNSKNISRNFEKWF